MSNSGLGTSSQDFSALGNTSQASQTKPWGPAQSSLKDIIGQANSLYNMQRGPGGDLGAGLTGQEAGRFYQAIDNVNQIPNFGPAFVNQANKIFNTGGDPTGYLGSAAQGLQGNINNLQPYATQNLDPTKTPGMQNVLDTIRNDISNQVNGQFAGAGRSLSGLNTQTLSRGISQGEAVPLLNQYNQNFSNMLGANNAQAGYQGQRADISQKQMANLAQGAQFAQQAPSVAASGPMMAEQIAQQANNLPFQYLAQRANLINPIAGLGGSATGTQSSNQSGQGTATNSLLSQLGQALGLFGPIAKFAGTF